MPKPCFLEKQSFCSHFMNLRLQFKPKINTSLISALLISGGFIFADASSFDIVDENFPNPDNEPAPVHPLPSERQLKWNETEFYAFFHYGMNTFTDKEWGYGDEDENLYAPKGKPNPYQWLEAAKTAGMKGGIAVVKHHDGFCLWPTETTTHSIINSNNDNAKVNIPEEFGKAARELDMKYGFYISPWDRNSVFYGDGSDRYTRDVFLRQCAELMKYGDNQFEMWFDGANGGDGFYGGANESRKIDASIYYDIPNLRDSIHKVLPDCVMWGMGGEARWIGNEAGWAGETNWSLGNNTRTNGDEYGFEWCAGESDTKATDKGWFWHEGQEMKPLDKLWQIYLETVGRNATLILNIPPDNYGLIPDSYVERLKELGELLNKRLGSDLAKKATVSASKTRKSGEKRNYEVSNLTDDNKDTYWATDDNDIESSINFMFPELTNVHYVMLQEYIKKGQRIKGFEIEITEDGKNWEKIPYDNTTTIGYKRIVPLNGSTIDYGEGFKVKGLRINITDSKACPLLHTVSIY